MTMDPSTQRARSVVKLVILTVAVPSLLLTMLGAVAVENEEQAAKKRIETAYDPIIWEIASRFNQHVDQLTRESAEPFADMVRSAQGKTYDHARIHSFLKKTASVSEGYFVIDPSGNVNPHDHDEACTPLLD